MGAPTRLGGREGIQLIVGGALMQEISYSLLIFTCIMKKKRQLWLTLIKLFVHCLKTR